MDKTFIVKAKFFHPISPDDFVPRERLDKKLNEISHKSIALISAPTGYGKSTLLANWLRNQPYRCAWLSLSEHEDNFQQFIRYFTYAIKQKIAGFGNDIIELINAPQKLPVNVISEHFLNALAELNTPFILVLDDYHLIRNVEIHTFISNLFTYPQPNFHLIISTRRDPGLPLSEWRIKNLMVEIRANDFKFKRSEIGAFIHKLSTEWPDDGLLDNLEIVSEGWITGLRLIMLSVNELEELTDRFVNLESEELHVFNNLIIDILNRQPTELRECLLKLSLLQEFNADLFNAVCASKDKKPIVLNSFTDFIETLTRSNLFLIPLDDKQNWFRFHHLFAEMLCQIAEQDLTLEERNIVLDSAANFLHEKRLNTQALEYFLKAARIEKAITVFKEIRLELLNQSNWPLLDQLFSLFSENHINQYGILSLTKGWLHIYRGNIPEMIANIAPTEKLIVSEGENGDNKNNLLGELEAMRAYSRYNFDIDIDLCLKHSRNALNKLNPTNIYPVGMAWIFYGGAMQSLKQSPEAKKLIHEAIYSSSSSLTSSLLLILCYIEWLDGNLANLSRTAKQLITFGVKENHKEAQANGWYFYGMSHYFTGNDLEAHKAFKNVYDLRHFTIQVHSFFGTLGLANILAGLGHIDEAEQYVEELENSAMENGGPIYILFARAFIAEFRYFLRHKKSGLIWAKETHDLPLIPMSNFSSPQISQIRILAQDEDPESWIQARTILNQIIPFLEKYNNLNFLIRAKTLDAIISYKCGEKATACDTLLNVFELSEPRGFIRPFTELGSQMSEMLIECRKKKQYERYIDELLQKMSFDEDKPEKPLLTTREIQVLLLLGSQLSNKEVGLKLFISEATVKRHIANIFKKLNVANRKEALLKAKELSLV